MTKLTADILDRLKKIVGPSGYIDDPADMEPYCVSWRDGWRGWVAASCTGAATLMKHAALLERTHLHKNSLDKRNDSAEDRHQ